MTNREDDLQKLSLSVIEDLKGKGWNQSEIAEHFGVSRQAVSWHRSYYGGRRTPRELVLEHFPIQVNRDRSQTSPFRRLRDWGEWMATNGMGMPEEKIVRLRGFLRKLREENLILEYDPNIPPIEGVSKTGGFAFRPRKPQDGDLLLRENEYTEYTDYGRMIWRFPPPNFEP